MIGKRASYDAGGTVEPLKTITCIVDRRVLTDLLEATAELYDDYPDLIDGDVLAQLAREVESGERCELYARDWPGSWRAGE